MALCQATFLNAADLTDKWMYSADIDPELDKYEEDYVSDRQWVTH